MGVVERRIVCFNGHPCMHTLPMHKANLPAWLTLKGTSRIGVLRASGDDSEPLLANRNSLTQTARSVEDPIYLLFMTLSTQKQLAVLVGQFECRAFA